MTKGFSQWVLGMAYFLSGTVQGDHPQWTTNPSSFSYCFGKKSPIEGLSILKRVCEKKKA